MVEFVINPLKNKPVENFREVAESLKNSKAPEYHKTIKGYEPTPLVSLPALAEELNLEAVHVKDESQRFGLNAFKALGASYAVFRYLQDNPGEYVFSAATDGNHGRALAWASRLFGQLTRIFVPEYTTSQRIKSIRKEGAVVHKIKGGYDLAVETAKKESIKNDWVLIQDTSWENYSKIPSWVIAGYQTLCSEVDNQTEPVSGSGELPYYDLVLLQCGVGSYASSVIWYYLQNYGDKSPDFVLVEPAASCGVLRSILNGRLSSPGSSGKTIMAGLNCGKPSLISWPLLRNNADGAMVVYDEDTKQAMRKFYYPTNGDPKIVSGESGAAGMAGLLKLARDPAFSVLKEKLQIGSQTKVLLINTEGDTDRRSFRKIVK